MKGEEKGRRRKRKDATKWSRMLTSTRPSRLSSHFSRLFSGSSSAWKHAMPSVISTRSIRNLSDFQMWRSHFLKWILSTFYDWILSVKRFFKIVSLLLSRISRYKAENIPVRQRDDSTKLPKETELDKNRPPEESYLRFSYRWVERRMSQYSSSANHWLSCFRLFPWPLPRFSLHRYSCHTWMGLTWGQYREGWLRWYRVIFLEWRIDVK